MQPVIGPTKPKGVRKKLHPGYQTKVTDQGFAAQKHFLQLKSRDKTAIGLGYNLCPTITLANQLFIKCPHRCGVLRLTVMD